MMALIAQGNQETMENIIQVFTLCQPDCKLKTTDSGKKCIEIVKSNYPDIVILDKYLPDYDSFEVLKQIRMCSQVPVIFTSSLVKDGYETVKALTLGADAYITKPIRQLEFMARIRALLSKRKINKPYLYSS